MKKHIGIFITIIALCCGEYTYTGLYSPVAIKRSMKEAKQRLNTAQRRRRIAISRFDEAQQEEGTARRLLNRMQRSLREAKQELSTARSRGETIMAIMNKTKMIETREDIVKRQNAEVTIAAALTAVAAEKLVAAEGELVAAQEAAAGE